eukprot:3233451-Prymnesium_polylepis.1
MFVERERSWILASIHGYVNACGYWYPVGYGYWPVSTNIHKHTEYLRMFMRKFAGPDEERGGARLRKGAMHACG